MERITRRSQPIATQQGGIWRGGSGVTAPSFFLCKYNQRPEYMGVDWYHPPRSASRAQSKGKGGPADLEGQRDEMQYAKVPPHRISRMNWAHVCKAFAHNEALQSMLTPEPTPAWVLEVGARPALTQSTVLGMQLSWSTATFCVYLEKTWQLRARRGWLWFSATAGGWRGGGERRAGIY